MSTKSLRISSRKIRLERNIFNKDGQGLGFTARALAAAVVTQLFSYMIGKGIQYGYVCTGYAFVFLRIPRSPATVYFSVCVPNLDVMDDEETRLYQFGLNFDVRLTL